MRSFPCVSVVPFFSFGCAKVLSLWICLWVEWLPNRKFQMVRKSWFLCFIVYRFSSPVICFEVQHIPHNLPPVPFLSVRISLLPGGRGERCRQPFSSASLFPVAWLKIVSSPDIMRIFAMLLPFGMFQILSSGFRKLSRANSPNNSLPFGRRHGRFVLCWEHKTSAIPATLLWITIAIQSFLTFLTPLYPDGVSFALFRLEFFWQLHSLRLHLTFINPFPSMWSMYRTFINAHYASTW